MKSFVDAVHGRNKTQAKAIQRIISSLPRIHKNNADF